MKLYTICPDPYQTYNYEPKEGIVLNFMRKIPCFKPWDYAWQYNALEARNIDPNLHILPILLNGTKRTIQNKNKLQEEVNRKFLNNQEVSEEELNELNRSIYIKHGSLHKNNKGILYIKEEDDSQDDEVIVSLSIPLSAAQPHYTFDGKIDILIATYANYYTNGWEIEEENILCNAIIKMGNNAKLSVTYSNRGGEGVVVQKIMGMTFNFTCHDGKLSRFDDFIYSDFKL